MTTFTEHFTRRAPEGLEVPAPLARAWDFMEEQGWGGIGADDQPYLTPYAGDSQLGPVFSAGLSIRGWLDPAAPGADRLVPIAETDGSGGLALIWIDDDQQARFVGLSSEGGGGVRLADTAIDFLRLLAIGYSEFQDFAFGEEPYVDPDDDEDPVAAHAEFRGWVESTFAVAVPALWEADEDEAFTTWLEPLVEQYGIGLD